MVIFNFIFFMIIFCLEKSLIISENTKIIDSMVIQVSELKNNMEIEIKRLNNIITEKTHKILEIEQIDNSNVIESKQLKIDLELLQKRYNNLQQEYLQFKVNMTFFNFILFYFKERAQYVLKQQQNGDSDNTTVSEPSSSKSYFVELQNLIETLRLKNNEISSLTLVF